MDSPNQNPRWPLERAMFAASIPPTSKFVLLTLLTETNGKTLDLGRYSPGTRRLAEMTGLSREIVIKHLGLLEAHGWLAVRKRKGLRPEYVLSEGQPFRVSGYKHVPPRRGGTESRTTSAEGGTKSPTTSGTKSPTTSGTKSPTTSGTTNGTTFRPADRRSDWSDREPDRESLSASGSSNGSHRPAAEPGHGYQNPHPQTPSPDSFDAVLADDRRHAPDDPYG